MKKALISPVEAVNRVASWNTSVDPCEPVIEAVQNGARIAQVSDSAFDVAPPLFWVDCEDAVADGDYCYDMAQGRIVEVVHAPHPNPPPTQSSGEIPSVTL